MTQFRFAGVVSSIDRGIDMLTSYLKSAVRNIRRTKLYSIINVSGLALGFAAAILIVLWILNQFSYDRYNVNAERIYRVTSHWVYGSADYTMPWTPGPLADALSHLPQVESATRLSMPANDVAVKHGDKLFNISDFFYTDPEFFKIFTVKMLEGNPKRILTAPYSIVLTRSLALCLFGGEDAVGKFVNIKTFDLNHDFLVTGVIQDFPRNSQFHPVCLASYSTVQQINPYLKMWQSVGLYTYFMLRRNSNIASVKSELPLITRQYLGKWGEEQKWSYGLQKLTAIHLHSHLIGEIEPNGSMETVYIFGAIGLFILLVSIINFISITTVGFSDRTKEVGVRKVVGAVRREIVTQLISEGLVLSLIASAVSVSLVELTLPYFNDLTGQSISFGIFDVVTAVVLLCCVGIATAAYPALFLSAFKPTSIFQKKQFLKSTGVPLRKALIVLQFGIAVAIIASTIVTGEQLHYLRNKDLGFDKERVMVIPLRQKGLMEKYAVMKQVLTGIPGVKDASGASGQIGNTNFISNVWYHGQPLFQTRYLAVDYVFLKTMGIKIVSGRHFSKDIPSDTTSSILVNESAAEKLRAMGLIDKTLQIGNVYDKARVVGVMKNFNYRPLLYPVEPLVVFLHPEATRFMVVRIDRANMGNTIAMIEAAWKKTLPEYPLDWRFQDRTFEEAYKSDSIMKSMFDVGAGLSVLISMLGLFGLASYGVQKRSKEIGVRKVLGASEVNIISLLTRDFIMLVTTGAVIGCLAAYYFMMGWLENFAFKIELSVWPFLAAAAVVFVAATLTVFLKTLRASAVNPAETLRYE